jgi:hypothetical protein
MSTAFVPTAEPDWIVRCGDLRVPVDRSSLDHRYSDWAYAGYRSPDGGSSPWPVDEVLRVTEPGHPGLHLMGLLTDGAALLSLEVCESGSEVWQPAPFAVAHHVVWIAHVPSRTTRLHLTTTAGEKSRTWASLQAVG